MTAFRADLHCHSTCSDGTLTPEELVRLAYDKGLNGLSITDHDNTEAYELALPVARQLNFPLIPGVEFSASLKGVSVHILGYSFTSGHPALKALCDRQAARRLDRNMMILANLDKLGLPLSIEEVISISGCQHTIGRPHIALAMIKKGYVESIQKAFKKFLGEGKPAFATGSHITPEETIEAIHAAQGFAIIAHPHLIVHNRSLKQLLEMNFDGLECFYSRFQKEQNKRWVTICQKKGWIMTGGSDFHGDVKPNVSLGCSWVDQETFQKLQERFTPKENI